MISSAASCGGARGRHWHNWRQMNSKTSTDQWGDIAAAAAMYNIIELRERDKETKSLLGHK